MALQKENKQLFIDKEALSSLSIAKQGLLHPVTTLMNEKEMIEVSRTGLYKGMRYPCPFLLSPSGKRNEEVLKNAKKGQRIDFITNYKHVGHIIVDSVFEINKKNRILQITGNDYSIQELTSIESRIGKYCIHGEYTIYENEIKEYKNMLSKKMRGAKKATAIMLNAAPLHRVHEKIMRAAFQECDLLVIFLMRPANHIIDYDLRLKCVEYLVENYFVKEKIMIIPLDDTYLYAGQNKMLAHAIVAKNFGCSKFIVGENNQGLSTFYIGDKVHSVLDDLKNTDLQIQILPEYVYCYICETIISAKICPHSRNNHVRYNATSMIEFFKQGIMPPEILMRAPISSILLRTLHNNKFTTRFYHDILPQSTSDEVYLQLMRLYQVK